MRMKQIAMSGVLLFLAFPLLAAPQGPQEISIIPQPVRLVREPGVFVVTGRTTIVNASNRVDARSTVEQLAARLRAATGYPLRVVHTRRIPTRDFILFRDIKEKDLGVEGYQCRVSPSGVEISAPTGTGLFYGMETLLQLLPPQVYDSTVAAGIAWEAPCVSIWDKPRFQWRGMHLDVSRHFFPVSFIYTYIDLIAMHKMNVFHWHLTDDQGWRIQIKKYPRLTDIGAWRVNRKDQPWNGRDPQRPGEQATYGGYYTQDEIRAIVRYAAARHVTIVPEIEMPAHSVEALAAYPQFSCTGGPFTVPPGGVWPDSTIFCAGNDSTFIFLENILTEVMDLFPGKYIHIGGDEATKTNWERCPKCQARIKQEGLKNTEELQSYFIKRIASFLQKHHRHAIGWDEILEGGLPPGAAVMSWRGMEGGMEAVRQGSDVVMTPGSYCYLDAYQDAGDSTARASNARLPMHRVYKFNPVPDSLTPAQQRHILGAEACVWTEYVPTPQQAEKVVLPRMAAMAEVLWSPLSTRNWNNFVSRLDRQIQRYSALGYSYSNSTYNVEIAITPDPPTRTERVTLSTETLVPEIRYTLDGSVPTAASPLYHAPFVLDSGATIRAVAFRSGSPLGQPTHDAVTFDLASFKEPLYEFPYSGKYTAGGSYGLADGLRGSTQYSDGRWQGFLHDDMDVRIDLGDSARITSITCGFLENPGVYIFFPDSVKFSVSLDGSTYLPAGVAVPGVEQKKQGAAVQDLSVSFKAMRARFIRIHAKNIATVPAGYLGVGEPAWIFADEVIVR
jgi:hexosaminidase